ARNAARAVETRAAIARKSVRDRRWSGRAAANSLWLATRTCGGPGAQRVRGRSAGTEPRTEGPDARARKRAARRQRSWLISRSPARDHGGSLARANGGRDAHGSLSSEPDAAVAR